MTGDVVLSYLDYFLLSGTGALQGIIDSFHVVVRRKGLRRPAALHRMFSRSAAVRRATIEVETTAGVFRQRSIKVQSTRGAILRMLQKKDGNSMAVKQFLWQQTNPLA